MNGDPSQPRALPGDRIAADAIPGQSPGLTSPTTDNRGPVAIIGGGLAGLAAAVALAGRGLEIELYEARRRLGGRAASFTDPATGEQIDLCQHVGLGCCTNLADFCRRTGIDSKFRRDRVLHFFAPDGRRYDFTASRWLPAPLHLAPALLRMGYLSWSERLGIARALWKLARDTRPDGDAMPTVGTWLREQGQSKRAIEQFWGVVLVSALGETVDRASLVHARKVFVDGFMANRTAYEVEVPRVPLGQLYGETLETWLARVGVKVHLGVEVASVAGDGERVTHIVLADGTRREVSAAVVALPWRSVGRLFEGGEWESLRPTLATAAQIEGAPITSVHLWFDREITPLPHAVLLGTLAQWVFNRPSDARETGHYYQVVISGSHELASREKLQVIEQIVSELTAVWPATREATLQRWRMVTEPAAVFSVRPGIERLRPTQRTAVANLALAGDWTATGWPATMEGAVRSGYLAAEAIMHSQGRPEHVLMPDLPRAGLARWLLPA